MSFRVLVHLTLAGYRGHVFTETHSSRSDDCGERLAAARAAFAARDIDALSGISVVIINMPTRPLGDAPHAMWAADFLALAEAQFAKK